MCGRYLRKSDKQRIAESFHTRNDISTLAMPPDDYNIAPSTFQPVIRESKDEGSRELVMMRWGLIPFFTKQLADLKGRTNHIARAETISFTPTWRGPFQKRRCIVPASGFYEWPEDKTKSKQPYAFTVPDSPLFAFAGLWDAWKDPAGGWLQSFSIVTTEANELMSSIHTRMPVILHSRDYDRWLSREATEQLPVDLLRPFASEEMQMNPANPLVGNVKNNGIGMLGRE